MLEQRKSEILTCILYDDLGKEIDRLNYDFSLELLDNAMRLLNAIIADYKTKSILYLINADKMIEIYHRAELFYLMNIVNLSNL